MSRRVHGPNHMFRSVIAAIAILAPSLALAQDKPITVYFQPCKDQQLNDAITAALSAPGFVQVLKPGPGVLIVSIPDKIEVDTWPDQRHDLELHRRFQP